MRRYVNDESAGRLRLLTIAVCSFSCAATCATAFANGLPPAAVKVLQTAESAKANNQTELAQAWAAVSKATLDDLPAFLDAFADASPTGINWLSTALDSVLDREAKQSKQPSATVLVEYVLDAERNPLGRETALNLLETQDDKLAEQTVDKLLTDPVARLRRPAIAALLGRTKNMETEADQLSGYQQAFRLALSEDHVVAATVALRELGHPVDHIRKFGFLMHWQVIGPFDFKDGEGFDVAYPPESLTLATYQGESGIYSDAEFPGKTDDVSWKQCVNTARNGDFDLNKTIGELRDVVAYGATVFESDRDQSVQLRLRQQNSAKIWLNGELVFSQEIGHTGNFFDQYIVPVDLHKGPNLIVVKSCQTPGPVFHPFVNTWQFSVRVTDQTGNAILALNRPPTPELDALPEPEGAAAEEPPESEPNENEPDSEKQEQPQ